MDGVASRAADEPDGWPELRRAAGLELRAYRPDHVAERVRRALARERADDTRGLAALLRRDAEARRRFRSTVAVTASGMFRDRRQFELLEREVLPALMAGRQRLRVWSAGCAAGQELVSLAIVLDRLGGLEGARLLGSDVLEENLHAARRGDAEAGEVPARLRRRLRCERRDVVTDPPPGGRWSLILCRNVAIYLGGAATTALHERLAGALARGGVLLLGRSERLADPGGLGLARIGPNVYGRTA